MAWVVVDKDVGEVIFQYKPHKGKTVWYVRLEDFYVNLPSGTIRKLIGRDLYWDDEPVELT